jgi:hypothetical protein
MARKLLCRARMVSASLEPVEDVTGDEAAAAADDTAELATALEEAAASASTAVGVAEALSMSETTAAEAEAEPEAEATAEEKLSTETVDALTGAVELP